MKKTPAGNQKVIDTKARHVDSARNQLPAQRRADIEASLDQVKNQLVELEKAGKIGSQTKGAVLRVVHDSNKGKSSAESVVQWREEANAVRNEWVNAAENATERALRSRVIVTTTTRETYTAATKNLRKVPHAGIIVGLVIAAYILADTGDAYAAGQALNPAANTTDVLVGGANPDPNARVQYSPDLAFAKAIGEDLLMLTPQGAATMLLWTVMQPRGDNYWDDKLAKRAVEEGRNPFCAQCHGQGGALDPNNDWNRRNEERRMNDLMEQFKNTNDQAILDYVNQMSK